MTDKNLVNHLSVQQYIFWDFDGVIKDSVEVKSSAFEQLFKTFGINVANKVKCHHEANSGISRFDKLPIYLEWSGQHPTQALIQCYSEKFSRLVKQKVIESEWVPGVLNYLEINSKNQIFFLITATPQAEIEEILNTLEIQQYFRKVIGAPTNKKNALKMLLDEYSVTPYQAIMIGDSNSDYDAALVNQIPFVLRRTNLNWKLQERLNCLTIEDFCHE